MIRHKLIIFVKAPRPGFVKSRLAATLGPDAAVEAYRVLVGQLLANLGTPPCSGSRESTKGLTPHGDAPSKTRVLPARSRQSNEALTPHSALRTPHSVELRFTPDDAFAAIEHWLHSDWSAHPQGTGDLGERMHRAFVQAFAAGAERVVLIGSDCPTVGTDDINGAWNVLLTHDLVLGPAIDGGYWLIGLRSSQAGLFQAMPWSTKTVLAETLERAAKLGLRVHLCSQKNDVDAEQDWREFLCAQSVRTG